MCLLVGQFNTGYFSEISILKNLTKAVIAV